MLNRRLRTLWQQLQAEKPHLPHFLSDVELKGIRGIERLRVAFGYPVCAIAGANGSGKSTVLLAAACAYRAPESDAARSRPSILLPDCRPSLGQRRDSGGRARISFNYSTPEGWMAMRWKRGKRWNRSFRGWTDAGQPRRRTFLRTLARDRSEARDARRISRLGTAPRETPMTPSQIHFAEQILPFRYAEVVSLSGAGGDLLFARRRSGAAYSELHMGAGERAILRLSRDIAAIDDALVLIDDVEAGLHPWAQQQLMLQLQRAALRNRLQVIVTTHSPAVLDSVPPHSRIFLDRDRDGRVTLCPARGDLVQNALYGRSRSAWNILCEGEAGEGILRGVFDVLIPREGLRIESVRIGHHSEAADLPAHAAAFRKFGLVCGSLFVLDGDKRESDLVERIRARAGVDAPVLFLPGSCAPETWIWTTVRAQPGRFSDALGISATELPGLLRRLDAVYDRASDTESAIAKAKLHELSDRLDQSEARICRAVARLEAECPGREFRPLMTGLQLALADWQEVEGRRF